MTVTRVTTDGSSNSDADRFGDEATDRSTEGETADDPGESEEGDSSGEDERTDGGLSMDDVFHLLQNQRRRDVLRYLDRVGGEAELSDLAEQVAAWEQDTTVEALSSKERKRVYVALYQSHLPKLDETSVVEYDQHRGTVRQTPRAELLGPYLSPPGEARADDADGAPDRGDALTVTDGAGAAVTQVERVGDEIGDRASGAESADGGGGSGIAGTLSDDASRMYYLGSAAGCALALLVGLDAPVFAALSWFHVAATLLISFTAITAFLSRS